MLSGLDGVLLRRQPKRIPAHRVKHVEATQPFIARDDVSGRVSFRMADMEAGAARVGEHVEHVVFWTGGIEIRFAGIRRVEGAGLVPDRLPLRLEAIERIRFTALVHAEELDRV
jgi:hypothetical protein